MAQIYKVLKDFELAGEAVRSGQEVVCRAREAEDLQKQGFLAPVDRELDPNDDKDAALLAKCEKRADDRHAKITGQEAERDAAAHDREVEKDKRREERAARVAELVPADENYNAEFAKLPDDKQEELLAQLEADAQPRSKPKP